MATVDTPPVRELLAQARARVTEEPDAAELLAEEAAWRAREDGDAAGLVIALALQGTASLQRGELPPAIRTSAAVEVEAVGVQDAEAVVEAAVFGAQLAFFTGAYRDALEHADRALRAADADGGVLLRLHARRRACLVLANLERPGWADELQILLELSEAVDDPWDIAAAHNDLACLARGEEDFDGALRALERGRAAAARVDGPTAFLDALLASTHAEVLLSAGRPERSSAVARAAVARIEAMPTPNPYLLGMVVLAEVQALLATGQDTLALDAARHGLRRIGDRTPQARAALLRELATTLRGAGRVEEAFDALAEAAELERVAFRQFTALQLDVERAVAVGMAARREAEALREAAEQDPLTGLHNRRHLDRIAASLAPGEPLAVAALDLDHFKLVNDRFGHELGDRVLVRAAQLLRATARASDVVARTGGEEFLIVMPRADQAAALAVAERLRAVLAAEPWGLIEPGLRVTASVGVAAGADGVDAICSRADARLYAAKRAGRDRVA